MTGVCPYCKQDQAAGSVTCGAGPCVEAHARHEAAGKIACAWCGRLVCATVWVVDDRVCSRCYAGAGVPPEAVTRPWVEPD